MAHIPMDPTNVTGLLIAWRNGDQQAYEKLVPLVYAELRRLAAGYLRHDRPDHTLQPTALVHEAYLRLNQGAPPECENRAHFMAIAARAMRDILVDHSRSRAAAKRACPQADTAMMQKDTQLEMFLQVHRSLDRLAAVDERKAQIVELRYFGGLSNEEVALYLKTSISTVERGLHFSKIWLRTEMKSCPIQI
ncbi:MAG: sigma-70 family RNA polymerase sigma factor [Acidobacteriaceae bacterium]|nr:sigma-70 family RNA polymerase sigma factor [Acidobacteriaceae bacterium]